MNTKKKPFNMEKHAYDQIKQCIMLNEFSPGERLLEDELSTKLDMSRTPIRKAMQRLETEMILETIEGKSGMRIYEPSEADIVDLTDIRENLEILSLYRASQDGRRDKFLPMLRSIHAMRDAYYRKDVKELMQADNDFHMLIYNLSDSKWLQNMGIRVNDCLNIYKAAYLHTLDESWEEAYDQHLMIYNLLMAGNIKDAIDILSYHIKYNKWKSGGMMSQTLGFST